MKKILTTVLLVAMGAGLTAADAKEEKNPFGLPSATQAYGMVLESLRVEKSEAIKINDMNGFLYHMENPDYGKALMNDFLILAAQYQYTGAQFVEVLVYRGANVNFKSRYLAWTPLMYAAWNGKKAFVSELLHCDGIDTHLTDDLGRTAEQLAQERGFDDIAELIRNHD